MYSYCKNNNSFPGLIGQINYKKETYPCINPGNTVDIRVIPKGIKSNYKSKNITLSKGEVISAGNMQLLLKSELIIENGVLIKDVLIESEWRYSQDKINSFATSNELYFTRDLYLRREVTEPRYKKLKDLLPRVDNEQLLDKTLDLINAYESYNDEKKIKQLRAEIDKIKNLNFTDFDIDNLMVGGWGSNEDGDDELRNIFGDKIFNFPKPVKLISKLIASYRDKNIIILDSFAGSGTTAHAVIKLNKKDGGNRKFILVEMEDYAESITAERVKRVMQGYGADDKAIEGTGGSFDFYELGQPIFKEDKNLNEEIGEDKIREYIYYTETKQYLKRKREKEHWYLLDTYNETGYYFYYGKDKLTTLSIDTLNIVTEKAEQYIIYADVCLLDKDYMLKHNIIFKKIPRDIKRF